MTMALICAALATAGNGIAVIVGGVTVTTNGIDPPPAQLSTAALPAVYIIEGDSDNSWNSEIGTEEREYVVQVAVEAKDQSTRETRANWARALIPALRDKYAGYSHLAVDGVQSVTVTGTTGALDIEDRTGVFVGFEITINVVEMFSRTYATGE